MQACGHTKKPALVGEAPMIDVSLFYVDLVSSARMDSSREKQCKGKDNATQSRRPRQQHLVRNGCEIALRLLTFSMDMGRLRRRHGVSQSAS